MQAKLITRITISAMVILLTTLLASCEGNVPKGPAATTANKATGTGTGLRTSPGKTTSRTMTSIMPTT